MRLSLLFVSTISGISLLRFVTPAFAQSAGLQLVRIVQLHCFNVTDLRSRNTGILSALHNAVSLL